MLAVVACEPHKLEVGGANPPPVTKWKVSMKWLKLSLHFYLKCRKYF